MNFHHLRAGPLIGGSCQGWGRKSLTSKELICVCDDAEALGLRREKHRAPRSSVPSVSLWLKFGGVKCLTRPNAAAR